MYIRIKEYMFSSPGDHHSDFEKKERKEKVNVPCPTWGLSGTKRIFSDMITLDEAK